MDAKSASECRWSGGTAAWSGQITAPGSAYAWGDSENTTVDLARIGWLLTVLICLITVLILVLQGYIGYAGVVFAVAVAAAVNLF